jgi:hypothetical protein
MGLSRKTEILLLILGLWAAMTSWLVFDQGYCVSFSWFLLLFVGLVTALFFGVLYAERPESRQVGQIALVVVFALTLASGLGGPHYYEIEAKKTAAERKVQEEARPRVSESRSQQLAEALPPPEEGAPRDGRFICRMSMEDALKVHRVVDETMMGSENCYGRIYFDEVAWYRQDPRDNLLMIGALSQARLRRFGSAHVEVVDGYSGRRLGGWNYSGPYLEKE